MFSYKGRKKASRRTSSICPIRSQPFAASVWHCRGKDFRGSFEKYFPGIHSRNTFQEYIPGIHSLESFPLKNNAAKKQSHRYNTRRACTCFHSRYKRYLSSSLFVLNTKRIGFIVSTSKVSIRIAPFWHSVNGKMYPKTRWPAQSAFLRFQPYSRRSVFETETLWFSRLCP